MGGYSKIIVAFLFKPDGWSWLNTALVEQLQKFPELASTLAALLTAQKAG